jgi:2-keto-3-deoxy-L-rhamnonate aldolase RhmA
MKSNRLREALAEGRPAIGHMILEFGTRGIAKILEAVGLDFVLIDMEHSGLDFGAVADLLAWFRGTPVAPIVRSECQPPNIISSPVLWTPVPWA